MVAQFFADVLYLLLQEVLTLLFVDVLAGLQSDVLLQLFQLCGTIKNLKQLEHSFLS